MKDILIERRIIAQLKRLMVREIGKMLFTKGYVYVSKVMSSKFIIHQAACFSFASILVVFEREAYCFRLPLSSCSYRLLVSGLVDLYLLLDWINGPALILLEGD